MTTADVDTLIEEITKKGSGTAEAPEDEKDVRKIPQRKPPKDGTCRRCGQDKPVNRLMLCYPCWVKTELEGHGWREGMPHPDWCQCEGLPQHQRRSSGN